MLLWLSLNILCAYSGYFAPEQMRLSWNQTANVINLRWVTLIPIPTYLTYKALLCENASDWQTLDAHIHEVKDKSIWKTSRVHDAHLEIVQGCLYQYYAGSIFGWSSKYIFRARTPIDSDLLETDLLVLANWGGGRSGVMTKNSIQRHIKISRPDAILHLGNMAYSMGDNSGTVGDSWLNLIESISAIIPYMTIPGHNEYIENYIEYEARFNMPVNDANQSKGRFYSFDIGRGHYIMISTEAYLHKEMMEEANNMTQWLIKDLETANKNRLNRPWIIMLSSKNFYCSIDWKLPIKRKNSECSTSAMAIRNNLEEIIYQGGVDLVIQGETNQYQRNGAIYKNKTAGSDEESDNFHKNPNSPIYISSGSSGNIKGHNRQLVGAHEEWNKFTSNDYGYGRLHIYNRTHLYYEQFDSENGLVIDHVWIFKDNFNTTFS